eukprot:TRINITY_DN4813_c0_g1_i9.p1 TRINITY_DN4813_c0_g1~~TRINITY_DN4813_c0_g1_i9.p1  ORF type:complete len:125 (+),score=11.55 TRINITY_DN4813_c0_g1_i9:369-743(+)
MWAILTIPPICFLLYKHYFTNEGLDFWQSSVSTEGPKVVISVGLEKLLRESSKEISLEDQILADRYSKTDLSDTLEIEMGGKKKTKRICIAALKGSTLFWQVKHVLLPWEKLCLEIGKRIVACH